MKPVRVSYILEKLHQKGIMVQVRNYKGTASKPWEVHMFPDVKSFSLSKFPVIKGTGSDLDGAIKEAFVDLATRLKSEKDIDILKFLEDEPKITAL